MAAEGGGIGGETGDGMAADKALAIGDVADADMPAIRDIYAHHVLHGLASWEETPPDLSEMIRRRDALLADGYPYRVAKRSGRVVPPVRYPS